VESWLRHFIPWAEIIPGSTSIGSKSLLRCRLRPIPTSELPVGAQTQREWTQSWANRSLFDGEFHSFPEGTPAPTQCAKTASPGHVPAGIRTVEITKPVPPVPRNVPVECAYIGSVGVNAEFNVQLPGGGSMVGFLEASRFTKEEIESGKTLVLYVSGVSGNRLQLARNDRPASWRQKRKG
jgi:hypothetical protein